MRTLIYLIISLLFSKNEMVQQIFCFLKRTTAILPFFKKKTSPVPRVPDVVHFYSFVNFYSIVSIGPKFYSNNMTHTPISLYLDFL
jgi:hypothetical protein